MLKIRDSRTGDSILEIQDSMSGQTKGELPKYKAIPPEQTLNELNELIEDIKNGKFKVVNFKDKLEHEVLVLPNPEGGKPITKPTGKKVKTVEIKLSNQVEP
jgi:hypothetical protein